MGEIVVKRVERSGEGTLIRIWFGGEWAIDLTPSEARALAVQLIQQAVDPPNETEIVHALRALEADADNYLTATTRDRDTIAEEMHRRRLENSLRRTRKALAT